MFKPTHIFIRDGVEHVVHKQGDSCFNESGKLEFNVDEHGRWHLPSGKLVFPCPERSNSKVIRLGPPSGIKKNEHHKYMPVGATIVLRKLPSGDWSAECNSSGVKSELTTSSIVGGVTKICKKWIRDYQEAFKS